MASVAPQSTPERSSLGPVDPYGLPAAITGRFLLLITAVIGVSLFAYDFIYLTFVQAKIKTEPRDAAWFMIGGVVILLAATAAIYLAMPAGTIRRHRLDPLTPDDSPELIKINGLTREARLAMAVWCAFLLTAIAPVAVTMLLERGWYLVGIFWRTLALALVVFLFRNAILRNPEHRADGGAWQWDGPQGALRRVLASSAASTSRAPTSSSRWGPLDTHPALASREAALSDPKARFGLGFWDALGAGLVATIAFGNVTMLINAWLAEPAPLTIRWAGGLVFAPLVAVGLTAGIWRTVLFAQTTGRQPPNTLAVGIGLGCGILLGEPLSLPAVITGMGFGSAPSALFGAVAVISLMATTVLIMAWIRSCALAWLPIVSGKVRRVVVITAIAAAAIVLTVVLGYWTFLHDLHPVIPILTDEALTSYMQLSAGARPGPQWLWIALNHGLITHLIHQDPIVVTIIVLWLFPIVGIVRRRSARLAGPNAHPSRRSTRPALIILIGLAGGAAYAVVLLLSQAKLHASIAAGEQVSSVGFLQIFTHWQVVGAVAAQATVALAVAVGARSFGILWGIFAAFITGIVATAAMLGTIVVGSCIDRFSVRPGACAWDLEGPYVALMLRWVLVTGALAAIAAGLLGMAIARAVRGRFHDHNSSTPPSADGSRPAEPRHSSLHSCGSSAAEQKDLTMKPIRSVAALLGGLAIWAALAACSGPGVAAPAAHSPSSAALSLTMSVPQTASRAADATEFDASAADERTCDIFREMVDGIDTLSTEEQQQLVIEIVDAAEQSENPDLTRAVVDLGQGWLDSNPEQFAKGMRALSKICNVPYE